MQYVMVPPFYISQSQFPRFSSLMFIPHQRSAVAALPVKAERWLLIVSFSSFGWPCFRDTAIALHQGKMILTLKVESSVYLHQCCSATATSPYHSVQHTKGPQLFYRRGHLCQVRSWIYLSGKSV